MANNPGFTGGASVGCTANCGAQANTNGALQYFDAAQVSAGKCSAVTTAVGNDQTCALTIVEPGDTVDWVYQDTSLALHSATSGTIQSGICTSDNTFNSGVFPTTPGSLYAHTFPASSANVYPYCCTVHGATMLGTVIVQDFTVAVTNSSLTVYKGANAVFNGQLTGLPAASNPYNFGVSLSCFNPTAGLTCTPPPAPQTPAPFTVNASAAVAQDYTFQIQGTGGVNDPDNLQHTSNTATLHVVDLSLSTPANITMGPSATSTASTFTATTAGTFPGSSVALSCSGLPAGASCSFPLGSSFNPSTSPHNLSVAVTTNATAPGPYTITVSADPGGGLLPKTTTFTLTVQDFSLTLTPPTTVSVLPNVAATFNGTVSSLNNYAGTIVISCQNGTTAPPATCTGGNVVLAGGATNVAIPTVSAKSAVNGQFIFNIQGAGPLGATHASQVTVNVGDFILGAPSPGSVTAVPGNPSNATNFTLGTTGTFTAAVALSCTGLPAGASCAFFPSANLQATSTTQTVSVVVQTISTTPVASGTTVTISALGNGITHTQPLTLNVIAGSGSADMALTLAHAPDPVQVGSTATFTATAKNNGPNAASSVTLSFDVSSGAKVISASAPGAVCNIATLPATCTLSSALAASASVTFTIKVRAPFTRSMSAMAQVSSSATDPTAANNSAGQNENIRLRPVVRNGVPAKLP